MQSYKGSRGCYSGIGDIGHYPLSQHVLSTNPMHILVDMSDFDH